MTEEDFASLLNQAQKQGKSRDQLVAAIKSAISRAYRQQYPRATKDFVVLFDPDASHIRILSGDQDITPPEFAIDARNIIRETLQRIIHPKKSPSHPANESGLARLFMNLIFFGYNGLSLFYLGISSLAFLSESVRDLLTQLVRSRGLYSLFTLLMLSLTPPIATFIAIHKRYYQKAALLAQLFFIFELPTVFLSLVLFSIFSKPIPAIWLFSLLLYLLPTVILLKTISPKVTSVTGSTIAFLTKELLLLAASYIALLYSFFFPLIIGTLARGMFGFLANFFDSGLANFDIGDLIGLLIVLPFGAIGLFILTILAFLPYIILIIIAKLFYDEHQQQLRRLGNQRLTTTTISTAVIFLLALLVVSYQPTIGPIAQKLRHFQQATSFEEREELARVLVKNEARIKQVILDAQNAYSRYLFVKDDPFLSPGYEDILNMPPNAAEALQELFSWLAAPFVYRGSTDRQGELSQAYEQLFGKNLYYGDGEKLPEPTKTVRLLSRSVSVQTDYAAVLATVSIDEIYGNTTFDQQEVIYEFTLPSEATITDLRLGPDLEFSGIIAPRGAAQRVYEQELRRRRDPALLEQFGPRNFRLRVFPIPGKTDRTTIAGRNQRVKFSYVVGLAKGGYPLPLYTREQNVFTDRMTNITYAVDGTNVAAIRNGSLLAKANSDNDPCSLVKSLSGHRDTNLRLVPHQANDRLAVRPSCQDGLMGLITNITNKRIAILYEASYDNRDDTFIKELIKNLKVNDLLLSTNTIDFLRFNNMLSRPQRLTSDSLAKLDLVYFGKAWLEEALNQLDSYSYDFIVVAASLAEQNSPSQASNLAISRARPVYVIKRPKEPMHFSDQLTTYIWQSGGQVVDSFTEAINHFAISSQLKQTENVLYVGPYLSVVSLEGILGISTTLNQSSLLAQFSQRPIIYDLTPVPKLSPTPTKIIPITTPTDPLTYMAAKGRLLNEMASFSGDILANTAFLDQLNRLAEAGNIVTPYSSLIALVNEQQLKRLEEEKYRYDRFERTEPIENVPGSGRPRVFEESRDLALPFLGAPVPGPSFKIRGGIGDGGDRFRAFGPGLGFSAMDGGGGSFLPIFLLPLIAISAILIIGGFAIFLFLSAKRYLTRRRREGS